MTCVGKDHRKARQAIVVVAVSLLSSVNSLHGYAGGQDSTVAVSFDEFIDHVTGDEVSPKEISSASAYRAKRVHKSLFRWIDRQGYYSEFIQKFQQWCSANGGRYVRNQDLDADCFDGKDGARWLGAYNIQIVTTARYQGEMTAGYATFYFFRQREMGMLEKKKLADDEKAKELDLQSQIDKYNEELASRKRAVQNLPIVKKIGQKICKTVEGVRSVTYLRPQQYLLTAFTENLSSDKIQVRIAAIRVRLPNGFANVDRLDGDVVLQNNSVVWDDPLLWHPCE